APVKAALQRADLDPGDLGSFFGAEPLDVAQDDGLALLGRKGADCRGEDGADLAGVRAGLGTRRDGGQSLVPLIARGVVAPLLDAEALRDLVKPSRKRRVAAEARQVPERRDQRFLKDLARVVLVAAHAQPESVDRALVAGQELLDGRALAALGLGEKVT